MATIYRDPMIALVIAKLEAEGPAALKGHYYGGDPILVPKSMLPAVFVSKDTTELGNMDSADDEHRTACTITVVHDKTRDFGGAFDYIRSSNVLYEYMEARNADFTLKPTAISYVLRKYQSLAAHLYINMGEPMTIEYGLSVDKRGAGEFAAEAVLRFEMNFMQLQPGLE